MTPTSSRTHTHVYTSIKIKQAHTHSYICIYIYIYIYIYVSASDGGSAKQGTVSLHGMCRPMSVYADAVQQKHMHVGFHNPGVPWSREPCKAIALQASRAMSANLGSMS